MRLRYQQGPRANEQDLLGGPVVPHRPLGRCVTSNTVNPAAISRNADGSGMKSEPSVSFSIAQKLCWRRSRRGWRHNLRSSVLAKYPDGELLPIWACLTAQSGGRSHKLQLGLVIRLTQMQAVATDMAILLLVPQSLSPTILRYFLGQAL